MKYLVLMFIICSTLATNAEPYRFLKLSEEDSLLKVIGKEVGEGHSFRVGFGIKQMSRLWQPKDGSKEDFIQFVRDNYITDTTKGREFFATFSKNYEIIIGYFNKVSIDLKEKMHLDKGEISPLDDAFSAYEPAAHFINDMFDSKIAFQVALNFKIYNLTEKMMLGKNWTDENWAYARIGDIFTSRVPSEINQEIAKTQAEAEKYISEYHIKMGNVLSKDNKKLFPEKLDLTTHWGIRDELKSHYGKKEGYEKQEIIYKVMIAIINQTIPKGVINSSEYNWNPYTNECSGNGKEYKIQTEGTKRYEMLLNNFLALKKADSYSPHGENYIQRKFEFDMEMMQKQVESLFGSFLSSPTVAKVGQLIQSRLGRKLAPWDIWYDGFKSRSSINEDELSKITKEKYPNFQAFKADLPNILMKLGFTKDRANYVADKVIVDPSRGSGHAIGALIKGDKAHLRTRIGKDGMDYKGYNIAVHEFGHNVEQTFSLNDVSYYLMNGVPNNAFTEAIAFLFQSRDLELLGIKNTDTLKKYYYALDNFWSAYEIMGVSMVDMQTWKWMYANPNATPSQLKEAVLQISKDVWNKYYAPVFGMKDEVILGIYSHMIDYPLYLSAYPLGHLIEFQLEKQLEGKNFGSEIERFAKIGKKIPNEWMKDAVGSPIIPDPIIEAVNQALKYIK